MKKILSLILIASLFFIITIPNSAEAVNEESGTTLLTYNVGSSYSITIPALINITNGEGTDEYKVNAGSLLVYNKKITFTITGATNYDTTGNKFRMVHGEDPSIFLGYSIKKGVAPDLVNVSKDVVFLEATAAEANAEKKETLTYQTDQAAIAGDYSDTVTITVALVDVH